MKMTMKIWMPVMTAAIAVTTVITSCKKKFDEPPAYQPPNITANTTIKALKLRHTLGQFEKIVGDTIIRGIVVADDKSGQFYKSIVIQDASAGITVRLDATNLYTNYPVGREVFIRTKGLYLGDYNGLVQIGGAVDLSDPTQPSLAPIPATLFDTYLVKGSLNNTVTPKVVNFSDLTTNIQDTLQSTLIQLNNFEFAAGDTSKTLADPTRAASAVNYTIKNCAGNSIVLRNSSFANFAATSVPNGNGPIVAIYTIFGSTKQLNIRDTADIKGMIGGRCALAEEDFEAYTSGTDVSIPGWKNIAEVGGVTYKIATFSGNKYATVTAFNAPGNPAVVTSWLISAPINLSGVPAPKLTFGTIDGFDNGATFRVYVSTNYTGSATPSTATWTQVPATISSGHATGYGPSFLNSGTIDLSAYSGQTIYIGFRYDGANPATGTKKTTTFELDNIKVTR